MSYKRPEGLGACCSHGHLARKCELCDLLEELGEKDAEIARLQAVIRDREAEILRIQTHETSAAHALDAQLSPEERAQFKVLADEVARLRAANTRMQALILARDKTDAAFVRSCADDSYLTDPALWKQYDAARRAVDEAEDLKQNTNENSI